MSQTMVVATGLDESMIPSLTVNELVGALIQEEASRTAAKSSNKSQALYAAKGTNSKKPYGKSSPKQNKVEETSTPKKRLGNCNWCGLPNHWEREF